jgi:hypothetical protein
MDVGEPEREIEVEPIEDPVPREQPERREEPEPRAPEKAPAR